MATTSRRRPSGQAPDGNRAPNRRSAPRSGNAAQPVRRSSSARRPPAHAAHARVSEPPRRKGSALPIVIVVLALVFMGGLGFFVFRSCSSGTPKAEDGTQGTSVEATQATLEEEAEPDHVDINLMMVGDILFHYQVRMSGLKADGSRNYDHVFSHIQGELEGQDIKVLNQETPLGGPVYTGTAPDGYDGYPEFNGPQEMGDAEAKAGFNVALKATNHAMDNSGNFEDPYTLVRSEQNFWATQHPEMTIIGEANPDDPNASVDDVYVYEKDGFRVALLNYTQDLNGNESHDYLGMVSMLEEEHVRSTMAKAREMADMIVVFPHWGEEYSTEPVDMQYEWANLFVEEGADVIIGNHPHVIEPVTLLQSANGKNVPCFWSTGNFISTSPSDESLVGGIAKVSLRKDADGTCSVTSATFVPVVSHLGLAEDMTAYPLYEWTDELAASNWLDTEINPSTYNTSLTPAWADEFCERVLGSGFDPSRKVFELSLTPSLPVTTDGNRA